MKVLYHLKELMLLFLLIYVCNPLLWMFLPSWNLLMWCEIQMLHHHGSPFPLPLLTQLPKDSDRLTLVLQITSLCRWAHGLIKVIKPAQWKFLKVLHSFSPSRVFLSQDICVDRLPSLYTQMLASRLSFSLAWLLKLAASSPKFTLPDSFSYQASIRAHLPTFLPLSGVFRRVRLFAVTVDQPTDSSSVLGISSKTTGVVPFPF